MANRTENVGIFTAYGFAREGGYVGTKAEFEEGLAKSANYATNAQASATAAANSATSASTMATAAASSAGAASNSAKDSEAYAIGKRNGTDVGSSDPAYHNNAKYYAAQAQQGGILVNDTTNNITYIITLKLINGKPVVEYETTV